MAIEVVVMMTHRGEDIAVLAIAFLPRRVLCNVILFGEDGAMVGGAGDGALIAEIDVVAVDGGNDPSGMEGDIADNFPLHWL